MHPSDPAVELEHPHTLHDTHTRVCLTRVCVCVLSQLWFQQHQLWRHAHVDNDHVTRGLLQPHAAAALDHDGKLLTLFFFFRVLFFFCCCFLFFFFVLLSLADEFLAHYRHPLIRSVNYRRENNPNPLTLTQQLLSSPPLLILWHFSLEQEQTRSFFTRFALFILSCQTCDPSSLL